MKLLYEGKRWILECTYHEKEIPKAHHFRWDQAKRHWYTTTSMHVQSLLAERTDIEVSDEAAEALAPKTLEPVEIRFPEGVTPFPYQHEGITQILSRSHNLLADEMGLGKTLQAIGVINSTRARNVLIISPKTLLLNWGKELAKFGMEDLPEVYYIDSQSEPSTAEGIFLINYDILVKHEWLDQRNWDLIIADEAHYIKNPKAKRTRAAESIIEQGNRVLFLTGTPIMNRPIELYPMLRMLEVEIQWMYYAKRFCNAVRTRYGWDTSGASNLDELQDLLRSKVMIRRLKKDVLTDLPDKTYQFIPLSPDHFEDILRKEADYRADYEEPIRHLRERLRASHRQGVKVNEYATQLRNVQNEARSCLFRLMHETALAKAPYAIEHIKELLENGPLVVFAHHKDVIELICKEFSNHVRVTGEDSTESRQKAVDLFQAGKVDLFVGSIKACSTGITLTRASTVLFVEQTLVPADLDQATDRLHRIGQKNNVLVQFLVIDKSLDQELTEMIATKKEIIYAALDEGRALGD